VKVMARWTAVPICPDCDKIMPPNEDGDFECVECDEIIESEDDDGW